MKRPDPYAVTLDTSYGPETASALDVGRKRCAPMLRRWAEMQHAADYPLPTMDILQLLASCYLQGLRDAAVTLARADRAGEENGR